MEQGIAPVISLDDARKRRELRNEPWVRPDDVAQHFGVSKRTVYRWVHDGCPVRRLRGGTLRLQISALDEWHRMATGGNT